MSEKTNAQTANAIYFAEAHAPDSAASIDRTGHSSLAGKPIAVKANIAVKGFRTSAGSPALARNPPASRDAPVVALLRRAGLSIVATAVMDELAYGFTGRNVHFGFVPNPHDADRLSGGSSSGPAAAIAAGILDVALGTDTNGSVRLPAALCGVWGLRPTAGAVSSDGIVPLSETLDTAGPIASTATYLTALADAIGIGVDAPASVDRIKLALVADFPAASVTVPVAAAMKKFADSLGVGERVSLPWAVAARAGAQVMTAYEAARAHRRLLMERSELLGPLLRDRLVAGACIAPEAYQRTHELRASLQGRIDDLFGGHDVLLLPTAPCEAPPATWETLETGGGVEPINAALGRCAIAFSFVGLPALSVPLRETSAAGLPIGAQLVGRPGSDGMLLALARHLEAIGLAAAHIVERDLSRTETTISLIERHTSRASPA